MRRQGQRLSQLSWCHSLTCHRKSGQEAMEHRVRLEAWVQLALRMVQCLPTMSVDASGVMVIGTGSRCGHCKWNGELPGHAMPGISGHNPSAAYTRSAVEHSRPDHVGTPLSMVQQMAAMEQHAHCCTQQDLNCKVTALLFRLRWLDNWPEFVH